MVAELIDEAFSAIFPLTEISPERLSSGATPDGGPIKAATLWDVLAIGWATCTSIPETEKLNVSTVAVLVAEAETFKPLASIVLPSST